MSRLEVQESPVEATKREKLHYRFKLAALLEDGFEVLGAEVRLLDDVSGEEVEDAVSSVTVLDGTDVRALVDFTSDGIEADPEYLLFCKATLTAGEIQEVYCKFIVFGV